MATKISKAAIFVVLAATLLQTTFAATYTVGDSTGWTMPTNNDDFYDNWADNKTFVVGDVLVFNFTAGQHNVAEVTEAAYDACTTTNTISTQNTGPVRITLNRTGEYYFICTFPGHCSAGQKLNVEVRNGNTTNAPAPRSSPNTPTTAVYTVGDSTGWTVPTNNDDFYDNWADNKTFVVGDVLVFNFSAGQHDVAEVTEAAYDACTTTNTISTQNTGPARITLNRTGEYYFICTFSGHCSAGQKLNVEVRNGNRTNAPTPGPSPNTPTGNGNAPTPGPSPNTPGGNGNAPTPGSSTNTPPSVTTPSSASSPAATFTFVFMSVVLVFLSY